MGESLKLLELLLIVGVVLGWSFWELYKLKQDKKKREAAKAARQRSDSDQAL